MRKAAISLTALSIVAGSILWIGVLQPLAVGGKPVVTPPHIVDKPVKHELAFENTTIIAEGKQMITNFDSIMVLVNKQRTLPADYVPADMEIPRIPFPFKEDEPRKYMRSEAAQALELLFAEASKLKLDLFATSGYRSYSKQKSIFENNAKLVGEEEANKTSAYPGQSEHQTGLAMDVTSSKVGYGLTESFGTTVEGTWLRDNAHFYGFIIRYPQGKEHITGYNYEPWHLRYVGRDVAEYIHINNFTLEEYFQQKYGY